MKYKFYIRVWSLYFLFLIFLNIDIIKIPKFIIIFNIILFGNILPFIFQFGISLQPTTLLMNIQQEKYIH